MGVMNFGVTLLGYSIITSLIVFRSSLYVSVGLITLHIITLLLLRVKLRKILRPIVKSLSLLSIILLTSLLFTPDVPLHTFKLVSTPWFDLNLTQAGFSVGVQAVLGFITILSLSGFYQLHQTKHSLTQLSKKYEFLTPFLLIQNYLSTDIKGGKEKKKKKEKVKAHGMKGKSLWSILSHIEEDIAKHIQIFRDADPTLPERVSVITAVTFLLFSTKIIKILPGIAYASGQKLALMIPLLFYVSSKAKGFSATITAFNFGLLSFVFGSIGQLGIVDLVRLVLLGICIDLIDSLLPRKKKLRFTMLILVGFLLGVLFGLFTGVLAYLFRVPEIVYLFLAPRIISNGIFGTIGGFLTVFVFDRVEGKDAQTLKINRKTLKRKNTYAKTR